MAKSIAIVLVLAVAVAAGIYFNQRSPQASSVAGDQPPTEQPKPQKNDPPNAAVSAAPGEQASPAAAKKDSPSPAPVKFVSGKCVAGPADAPVKVEVFSDYQCPACRRYYLETVRPMLADYALPGKVCVVYYEFPLQMHEHARPAARLGHAASMLGTEKWIRVTDALYFYQAGWSTTGQVEPVVAEALGQEEMARVKAWADHPKMNELIDGDVALGRSRGVTGTPTTFITANGKTEKLPTGIVQYPILRRYLDSLLAQAQ